MVCLVPQVACPPAGRSRDKDARAVREFCAANHVHVHDCPPKNKDWDGFVASLVPRFDVGVVASFGHLIPDNVIDHFKLVLVDDKLCTCVCACMRACACVRVYAFVCACVYAYVCVRV